MEISSLTFALICLIGFVVLLRRYDQESPPDWALGSWTVTLNAVISVISLLFRSSLMMVVAQCIGQFCWVWFSKQPRPLDDISYYDDASRGAFGGLRLLFRLKSMQLASLGAVITLAASATGPVFQQTVIYKSRPAIDFSQQAYAVAANQWGDGILGGSEFMNAYLNVPHDMQSASLIGLMSSNLLSLPDPPFECPTGNCTWDPFSTLAIGSKCLDITDSASLDCSVSEPDVDSCVLAAPHDAVLSDALGGNNSSYKGMIMNASLADDVVKLSDQPFDNLTVLLAMVQWVKAHNVTSYHVLPTCTLEASRCAFYVTVQELQAKVMNGVYSEEILQEYTTPEMTPDQQHGMTGNFWNAVLTPGSPTFTPPFAGRPPNRNTTFIMDGRAYWGMSSQIYALLRGYVGLAASGGPMGSDDLMLSLFKADNVTRAMHLMAQSMTTAIRANITNILQAKEGNSQLIAPEEAINGTVWFQQQFVVVRWGWVAFPGVLLVLASVLLVATVVSTHRRHIGFWKTSPLALLFHARLAKNAGETPEEASWRDLDNPNGMRKAASGATAQRNRHGHPTV
ncbi:hypothetical protein G7054_g10757 [Neopestalotiopsis clavispora]|nr:hypothetical protein G7054_g10757 [Neopestalotiopsis clavispora]